MTFDAIARDRGPAPSPEKELADAYDRLLTAPRTATSPPPGLGPDTSIPQLDQMIETAHEHLAVGALRLAYAYDVTGTPAIEAAEAFLFKVRVRLEAQIAEDYLRMRHGQPRRT